MRALERGVPADMARAIPPLLRAAGINPSFHPAWMMAGDLYILRGQYAHAVKVLDKAVEIERRGKRASNDHRLGIGAHWIKSELGLARAAYRRGDESTSGLALAEGLGMQLERPRFVWGFILGAADAATWYEAAAAHAVRGERAECLNALRTAADFG